jgi:hypothetical protein
MVSVSVDHECSSKNDLVRASIREKEGVLFCLVSNEGVNITVADLKNG